MMLLRFWIAATSSEGKQKRYNEGCYIDRVRRKLLSLKHMKNSCSLEWREVWLADVQEAHNPISLMKSFNLIRSTYE
jgi:hypothetical protein